MSETTRHTGVLVGTYTLMHADEVVAVARRESNSFEAMLPGKLPFGLRGEQVDFITFYVWLDSRVSNLQRTYMNTVYMARKVGRDLELILRDSCALSITDQFWVKRSDIDITWAELQQRRDANEVLAEVALSGNTAHLDWDAARQGNTSLFATKGTFPKSILGNRMQKLGGTQEREWVASVIGKALGLPVQDVVIANPSISGRKGDDGRRVLNNEEHDFEIMYNTELSRDYDIIARENEKPDDTLVRITLFTSANTSLVHASELCEGEDFTIAQNKGQHHRYFYDRLPSDTLKREFERVLILNWLISNHDMHAENYGCLYCPETFEIIGVAPSFDHNSADFDGTIPEFDVPDIIKQSIKHHGDVISKIESGLLDAALDEVKDWLTPEQKDGVRAVGAELVRLYNAAENPNVTEGQGDTE